MHPLPHAIQMPHVLIWSVVLTVFATQDFLVMAGMTAMVSSGKFFFHCLAGICEYQLKQAYSIVCLIALYHIQHTGHILVPRPLVSSC